MKQCVTIVTTLLIIILKCLIQRTIDVFITSAFHFQHNYQWCSIADLACVNYEYHRTSPHKLCIDFKLDPDMQVLVFHDNYINCKLMIIQHCVASHYTCSSIVIYYISSHSSIIA